MDNKTILCRECGTENEPQYLYCKNCGTALNQAENNESQPDAPTVVVSSAAAQQTYYSTPSCAVCLDEFESIPKEDMAAFVGKNAPKILQKFTKMELQNSKTSWCWPVAVLSLFFGPIGAAIWFFYRKMYKIAWSLLVIGVVLSVGLSLINPETAKSDEMLSLLNNYTIALENENYAEAMEVLDELSKDLFSLRATLQAAANTVISVISLVLTSVFAFHWYKKHAVSKIQHYQTAHIDPRYYSTGLSAIGGTSGGMLFVGILLLFFSSSVIEPITALLVKLFA